MARETAAAAIALREGAQGPEVCVVQLGEQWGVPWTLLGKGEVPKQSALRALAEAGVKANLQDVDPGFYRTHEQVYRKGIDKVRREVHFFRVRCKTEPAGGTWLGPDEALAKVTSKAVKEAMLHALGRAPAPSPKEPKPLFEE